jgi:hypothetical protein
MTDDLSGGDNGGLVKVIDLAAARATAAQRAGTLAKKQKEHLERAVDYLNERYCVVNFNGVVLVFENKPDPVRPGFWLLHKYTFPDFLRLFQNRRLPLTVPAPTEKNPNRTKQILVCVASYWLNSPRRRQYIGGIVFDPTRTAPRDYFNLWCGFGVSARRGSWRVMQQHLLDVVCSGNREHYEYLVNCAARMIQHPELPAEVCVVLKGEEGSGKGIFLRALYRIMGQHGLHLSHPEHLRGKHNAHLWYCVFLFVDEAFYAGDKQHESILKAMITEDYLAIEPKNKELFQAPNHLHLWMASNLKWVVPVGLRGRRWFVLDVAHHRVGDFEYFEALNYELEHGGLEAMLFDLQRRDLASFTPRRIPVTGALLEQKIHTLDTLHRWWLSVLERKFLYRSKWGVKSFREWSEFYAMELLISSYRQWCNEQHLFQRQSQAELRELMDKLYRRSRPRGTHPLYEVEQLPPGYERGSSVSWAEPELSISGAKDPEAAGKTSAAESDWLERVAVVRGDHERGYFVGSLEMARKRCLEVVGDIPVGWLLEDLTLDEEGDGGGD